MQSLNTPHLDIVGTPRWLSRLYAYVGAENNPHRYENERDRALQRIAMPTVSIAWVFAFHQWVGTPVDAYETVWCIAAFAYAVCSAVYRMYLRRHPTGGVHAQYAFLALDPLIVGWALLAAPEALAWWLVLMLVMIARVGFRYGLNAMKFELAFAWVGASMPLLFSVYWHTQLQMAASLVLMLVCTWWLFAPLNRFLGRAKQLDIENAKVQSLQESLRAKSEFLSRVSHELRSPLQSVVSALDLVEERYGQDPAEAELLSRIRRGATALHTQLRDLLTLARGEVGKIEINPMPFEAGDLVMSIARDVQNEAWSKGLALVVKTPEDPIFVVADAGRIDQILTNLLTNATRHIKRGSVTLTLHPYDNAARSLRFVVQDTGPGVSKDRIPTLFEPFTRFGEMTNKGDGAGLGLAVVRSVIDFLGGSIHVESELGRGTTFSVDIPAELLHDGPMTDAEPPGHRILVVDDRREVLEAISSVVLQLGYACDTASSAATAANLLGARPYGTVFIDLDMPVKTGFDLAAETRRGTGPNVRSRLLSMSAAEALQKRPDWPFNGHLTKPITRTSLQRAIDQPMPAAVATQSEAVASASERT